MFYVLCVPFVSYDAPTKWLQDSCGVKTGGYQAKGSYSFYSSRITLQYTVELLSRLANQRDSCSRRPSPPECTGKLSSSIIAATSES